MANMENIKVDEIKKICNILLDKLNDEGIKEIPIDIDNYWIITTDEWTDFKGVIQPAVGSLIDDVESLKMLIKDKERLCTFVDFDRLASVLRYISQKINPPEDA